MNEQDRRTFLTTMTGIAAFGAAAGAQQEPGQRQAAPPIDISWFEQFKGKHKQVFDLGSFDLSVDSPLRQPVTYLMAHREVSHLEPPIDINVICAISHKAFPMNATDALWEKYKLGEHWGIKDPQSGQPSVRARGARRSGSTTSSPDRRRILAPRRCGDFRRAASCSGSATRRSARSPASSRRRLARRRRTSIAISWPVCFPASASFRRTHGRSGTCRSAGLRTRSCSLRTHAEPAGRAERMVLCVLCEPRVNL